MFAADMTSKYGATVTLLFVVAPSDHAMISGKDTISEPDKGFGEQHLKNAVKIFEKAKVGFKKEIDFGHPAEMILRYSEQGYDAVILGKSGLSAIRGFLMGSISSQVSQHSKIPVIVVPQEWG